MNLDSSFPQFYETGLEDLCGYAVLNRGRYPIGDMNTNHDKPLTGFEPALIGLQPTALPLGYRGISEWEKYQQKPLTHQTNTAH